VKCRNCGNEGLVTFLNLGRVPLANRLVDDPKERVKRYPLGLAYCTSCWLVQVTHVVPPRELFTNYPYATGSSQVHRDHFHQMAHDVMKYTGVKSGRVLDIGSNDGTLLGGFKGCGGFEVSGIEPATNIAKIASDNGIETFNVYFDKRVADWFAKDHGQADIVTATNVLTHVDDLDGFLKAVRAVVKSDGWFVTETYYLPNILKGNLWDLIYHEHMTYFTIQTLTDTMNRRGFGLAGVDHVPVHGGSIRCYFKPGYTVASAVTEKSTSEIIDECNRFSARVLETVKDIRHFIRDARREGKTVIGYSAPAKATTLLNVCGLTVKDIPFILDDAPLKQGKCIPGTGIPILNPNLPTAPDEYKNMKVDYALIFAWNLANEIAPKLKERGIRAFVPLPVLREVT